MLNFSLLWLAHPYPAYPCDLHLYPNQCAARMGVALRAAGVDLKTFAGVQCRKTLGHHPQHIMRAQELADWLIKQTQLVGIAEKHHATTAKDFRGRKGIVFICNGWGNTDHIDVWDGVVFEMKGGRSEYFTRGERVWFWELC